MIPSTAFRSYSNFSFSVFITGKSCIKQLKLKMCFQCKLVVLSIVFVVLI